MFGFELNVCFKETAGMPAVILRVARCVLVHSKCCEMCTCGGGAGQRAMWAPLSLSDEEVWAARFMSVGKITHFL